MWKTVAFGEARISLLFIPDLASPLSAGGGGSGAAASAPHAAQNQTTELRIQFPPFFWENQNNCAGYIQKTACRMISLFPQLVGETNQGGNHPQNRGSNELRLVPVKYIRIVENFFDLTFSKIAPEGTFTPIFSELKLIQKGHHYNLFQTLGISTQWENTSVFRFSLGEG